MDVLYSLLKLVFICLIFKSSLTYAQDVCAQKGPCSCEFPNGTGIDLSPTAKSSFYEAQIFNVIDDGVKYELSIYYFHPCFDVSLNHTVVNSTTDSCNTPLSLCRHVNIMTRMNGTKDNYTIDQGVYNYMGNVTSIKFTSDGRSIVYQNGPSYTTVLLVCAQTENVLQVISLENPRQISANGNESVVLSFYSRDACYKQLETISTRSAGSTLLIIFFSFVIFYLVLGICTKKFLMGATGVEVIPNLAFWSDLPGLVKRDLVASYNKVDSIKTSMKKYIFAPTFMDGWAFTVSGFKLPPRGPAPAATSPDRNSYDSI